MNRNAAILFYIVNDLVLTTKRISFFYYCPINDKIPPKVVFQGTMISCIMILQNWLDHGENCELLHEINLP